MSGVERQTMSRLLREANALRCLVSAETGIRREGPLSGLTYLAKDVFDTTGRAPSLGLRIEDRQVRIEDRQAPTRDAAVLDIIDAAGAIRLGFAEMTALACEPSGSNPLRQRPLNPWNADKICGGSSSGSAVAVAAGLVDAAIGSDTAGSLRIPAHCCGVTAWKPTPGLVPTEGAMALAPSLDVLGFLARDAAMLRLIAGLFVRGTSVSQRLNIAVAKDLIEEAAPDIGLAVAGLATQLAMQGYDPVEVPLAPLLADCDPSVIAVLQWETSEQHGWRLADPDHLDAGLQARLRKGRAIDAAIAREAKDRLRTIADTDPVLRDHDVILLPVMSTTTPEIAVCEPGSPNFSARTLYALSRLTRFVNGLGLPTVALPCGFDGEGMPIAAQLVGRPGSDLALIDLAATLQSTTNWHDREPAALKTILETAA